MRQRGGVKAKSGACRLLSRKGSIVCNVALQPMPKTAQSVNLKFCDTFTFGQRFARLLNHNSLTGFWGLEHYIAHDNVRELCQEASMLRTIIITVSLVAATALWAHSGVKDPQVKARMDGMDVLAEQTKILGQMAKGATEFDAAKVQSALAVMADEADQVQALFEPKADDPKSEALPTIWTEWDKFAMHADDLVAAIAVADGSSAAALGQTLRGIGGACGACHKDYRQKN